MREDLSVDGVGKNENKKGGREVTEMFGEGDRGQAKSLSVQEERGEKEKAKASTVQVSGCAPTLLVGKILVA